MAVHMVAFGKKNTSNPMTHIFPPSDTYDLSDIVPLEVETWGAALSRQMSASVPPPTPTPASRPPKYSERPHKPSA